MTCSYLETAVAGDVNDTRDIALIGGELAPTDLVGATVEAHVWRDGVAPVNLAAVVQDPVRKIIRVSLGALGGWLPGLTVTEDTEFEIEYEVSFLDGRVWTWPTGPPDRIVIRPQGS